MKNIVIISLLILSKIGYSQLVINEVHVKPGASSTSQAIQSLKVCSESTFGEEFIEIYNPDPCQTIDISCYFIASSAWSSRTNGSFRFPAGTTIGPLGHISIGGPNSGATFNLYTYCNDPHLETGNDRWYLDNGDMYVALYDNTGTPINTVFWTSGGGEANKWGTDSDLDEAPEYAPIGVSCSNVISLPFPTANIDYAGGSPALGSSLSRTTDGSATWVEAAPTVNNCNNGSCNTATPFNVAANVSQPTCGNTDGSITLTPNPAGTYTYTWTPNVSSTNTATNLDDGTYQINVDDGNCTWDTTITLTAPAPFNVAANVSQPTCGNTDGSITLTPNPAGTYTYTWTPNVSSTNTASNLDAGTYQINVDDGNCTWDTTITLTAPAPFNVAANVSQPTCGNTDGSITLTPNPAGSYTYTWTPNVSSTNTVTNLDDGTYQINVDDGNCTWDTTITLTAPAPFNVAANVSQPTCGNTDGSITLTPNPAGTYTYTWTPNVSSTNTASNLDAGTYQINVDDGNCTWDTTITLTAPAPFNVAANVSQPTCGNTDGSITLTPNPAGTYTYTWTPNVSSTNTATNLDAGSYQINVDDGNCTWDTTITLDTPTNCGCVNPFTLTIDSTSNTVCNGSSACNYNGPSILINEINLVPVSNDGSLYGETSLAGKEGEWIELYNPNWCDSIDISGYLLGSYNSTGSLNAPASNGMGFEIPQGTVVPPLGFVVVRGNNAPTPPSSAIDIVVNDNGGNLCIDGNTRIWFQNAGGWFGFYDQNGNPQDIVQWGTPTSASDLSATPCVPSNSSVSNLASAVSSGISYDLGATPSSGQTYVRIPDGGNWSNLTQGENSSYGTCNDLINGCVVSSGGETSCNGSATVSIAGGTPPFTFQWDDPQNQTTQTADSLCPGTYTVVVSDSSGDCTQTISVTINDESGISFSATVNQPSCANDDGEIILSSNSTGNYVFNWNPSVSSDSVANNLSSGTYSVEVSLGNCSWDSTFTLTAPSAFTTVANVIQPTCENGNGSISLTPSINGNYTYDWTPNVSSSQSASNLDEGTYDITISNGNCSIDTSFNLTNVGTIPTPDFITNISDSLCSLTGETENLSSGASTYEWFIDGVSQGQSETISFIFEDNLTHNITLQAISLEGCTNSISNQITFNYFETPLFIPNVFTPNEDGKNDTWYVVGDCLREFECLIFNRWGNKLYEMSNSNDRWDGTYNGTPVPQGVYVYVLKATTQDGSKIIKHGNITKL